MKIINGFISANARLMVLAVLLIWLPQISQQDTGKKLSYEVETNTSSSMGAYFKLVLLRLIIVSLCSVFESVRPQKGYCMVNIGGPFKNSYISIISWLWLCVRINHKLD